MESKRVERAKRLHETDEFIGMVSRMVRAAGKRMADEEPDTLQRLIGLRNYLDAAVIAGVRGLRQAGYTWQEIGEATGTTRQAAIMKWSKKI